MQKIPFNRPSIFPTGYDYLRRAVEQMHLSGDGPFTAKCNQLLETMTGAGKVLLTTSCTHALEMTAILLDLQPGDEVIMPSFTFVSTANAYVLRGAKPIFVDIRPDTLNLDETLLESRITPRTKAIVPVHYAGVACEMNVILSLAQRHGIAVVEDNAHGLLGEYRGRKLGSLGTMATLSFHETKNFTCGEGGALLLNDPKWYDRAEIIREKGTNRKRFFRGQVDKYTWVDVGSSYLPSEVLAALLYSQLEAREEIQRQRLHLWNRYYHELGSWAQSVGARLPSIPSECTHPAHLFYLIMPTESERDAFIAHMKAAEVYPVFHYIPLHLSEFGRRLGGKPGDCPVTENLSARLVRLPLYFEMTPAEQDRVLEAARRFGVRS